jgi:hypothetical protein
MSKTAFWVLMILLCTAILLPFGYGLDLGPGPDRIRALVWEYMEAPWFSGVRTVQVGQIFEALLYTLPRYFFIYLVYNYYRTGLPQKRMKAVGALGALFPGLYSLILIAGWQLGWTQPPPPIDPYFPIYIPIPTISLLGIILLRIIPVEGNAETISN